MKNAEFDAKLKKFELTRKQFESDGVRLDAEFQHGFAVNMVRSGRIGIKKGYLRDSDGDPIKTGKKQIWARVTRTYGHKKAKVISPALPQYADREDVGRSPSDMKLQIDHLQYRYHKCRDIHTGDPLTGEAREEWLKGRNTRLDWLPEKTKSRAGHKSYDTINELTEIFKFVSELDAKGIERFQELVTQYKDGDEHHYPA
jgi:hypothetical protein